MAAPTTGIGQQTHLVWRRHLSSPIPENHGHFPSIHEDIEKKEIDIWLQVAHAIVESWAQQILKDCLEQRQPLLVRGQLQLERRLFEFLRILFVAGEIIAGVTLM